MFLCLNGRGRRAERKVGECTKNVPPTASERIGGTRLQDVGAVQRIFGAIFHDFGASGADLGAMLGSFWGRLEVIWRFRGPNGWRAASWGALGALWGPYWGNLGPFLGAHWGHHGPSWGRQGPSWGHLGAILARHGAILGHLGAPLGLLEGLREPPWRRHYES